MVRRKKWISTDKRPIVTVTGSRKRTIVFGSLSLQGKQLFKQYDEFNSNTFVDYLKHIAEKIWQNCNICSLSDTSLFKDYKKIS